ncbi:phosphopantetheine-binding protein [Streptomyces sp. NPDC060028]|uniref:phosphopantetheine-binding protein n=1 Tax=Streptomyces sp. NPDC060028 TaxID=3347041 RepID=UPI0036882549
MSQPPTPVEIRHWLTGHLAALLEVATQDIDPQTPLDALGVTSMEEVIITADLEARYGVTLPIADMRRHPSIDALAAHITTRTAAPAAGQAPTTLSFRHGDRMYDRLVAMLFEIGIDTSHVTAQTTFRQLDMDSLSLTELAVMAAEKSGTRADGMTLDTTLAEAAQQPTPAAQPQQA